MTMPAIAFKIPSLGWLKGPLALAAFGAALALSTGHALVAQMEKRAAEDRLAFGATLDTCIRSTCVPSDFSIEPLNSGAALHPQPEFGSGIALATPQFQHRRDLPIRELRWPGTVSEARRIRAEMTPP
jgi:hypothetical protein